MQKKRIVVKVGTSTLAHKTGLLNIKRVEEMCKVISDLKNAGNEIVLVSSAWTASSLVEISKVPSIMVTLPLEWIASSAQLRSKMPPSMVRAIPAFRPLALASSDREALFLLPQPLRDPARSAPVSKIAVNAFACFIGLLLLVFGFAPMIPLIPKIY